MEGGRLIPENLGRLINLKRNLKRAHVEKYEIVLFDTGTDADVIPGQESTEMQVKLF
jgi:hypothetical protein